MENQLIIQISVIGGAIALFLVQIQRHLLKQKKHPVRISKDKKSS